MAETQAGAVSIPAVDLVVVIDTSASMRRQAVALSEAVSAAIAAAKDHCPSDLRVEYLGVEGTFGSTKFTTTVRKYLTGKAKADESTLKGRLKGSVAEGGAQEDGALAIEDVTNHFDWRSGAKKAILYLSDEALFGGGLVDQEDIDAATNAIKVAKAGDVRVHTYLGPSPAKTKAADRKKLESEFARVASETGGQAFTDKDALGGFKEMLEKVICGSRTTPGSEEDAPCKDCGKPEAPAKTDPPAAKEPPVAPPPEKKEPVRMNDDLYAIVLSEPVWWAANNYDDNSDIYIHDPKTGSIKRKVVDNNRAMGQSNAITSDGWNYYVWNLTDVYREKNGVKQHMPGLSVKMGYSTDGFAFRQDNRGFTLYAQNPQITHFLHDPNNPNIPAQRLTVRSAGGGGPVPFGPNENQWVTDLAFDGNDRAYFINTLGHLWVVDDTKSLTEWKARYLCQVPGVGLPGHTRYIGIAFDADGAVYLCGGVVESPNPPRTLFRMGSRWSRRFISRFRLDNPSKMELVYDGGPRSGSYGDLASQAFPKITKV